ncbi:MAG: hypothetical protein D6729_10215 [Deltaproteobacteria bacterium]|nr:MAG: hypothetical protein D6729_10215 [Deltaproteobacteria bacterium]
MGGAAGRRRRPGVGSAVVSALTERLLPHVPRYLVRRRLAPGGLGTWGVRETGTLLHADFQGFTRLTERLAAFGADGALALGDILNRYFRMLLDEIALERGANLVAFGGDGFTLVSFDPDGPAQLVAAGLEMQEALALFPVVETPAGEFELALRVGVHRGPFFHGVVEVAESAQYLLGGRTLESVVRLEERAQPGTVAISREIARALGESVRVEEAGEGLRVAGFDARPPRRPPGARTVAAGPERLTRAVAPLISKGVRERLLETPEAPRLAPEYRPATALFVALRGLPLDGDPLRVAPVLEKVLTGMKTLMDTLGPPVRKWDVAEEGLKMIFLYGLTGDPQHAFHAAATAYLLREALCSEDGRFSLAFGLASGMVWTGEVGGAGRREYTALGDALNLAARLAQQARPWEILCGEDLAEALSEVGEVAFRAPMRLKGKATPVRCGALVGLPLAEGTS